MRPLRLRITGFTCFRDEQEVDFGKLDLFAIAGPTGAGKTSILDAMVFALYGEVPRMGAQRLGELISLGLDRASAILDFEVGSMRYRVARRIRRQGAAHAQIERLQGSAAQPLAEGVRGVEQEVRKLLGIDSATFLKAVVLPQGQFADFLRSKPAPRRGMLRSLLQLDVYERMRERASQLGRATAQRSESLRGRLDEDFQDATPERLATVDQRLGDLVREVRGTAERAERARRRLETLEEQARRHGELQRARTRLRALEDLRAQIDADEQRLERSERARPLVAILDAGGESRARHEAALAQVARIAPRAQRAIAGYRAAGERSQRASAAADEIAALNEARIRIEHVIPLLARRADVQRRAAEADAMRQQADVDHGAAAQDIASCRQQTATGALELDALAHTLEQIGHDPDRLQRVSEALAPAADLAARQRDLARARGRLTMLHDRLTTAAAHLTRAREVAVVAGESAREAVARHDRAWSALDAARRAHAAHDLRATLAAGDPCPVCMQHVAAIPAIAVPAALEQAAREERAAERDRTRHGEQARQARTDVDLAERAVTEATGRRDEGAAELGNLTADVESLAQRLAQLLGALVPDGAPPQVDVPALHADLRSRADRHAQVTRTRTEREATLAAVRHRQALAEQRVQTTGRDRAQAERAAAAARAELTTLGDEIQRVVPSGDPAQERRRLIVRIDELTRERDEAARVEQAARAEQEVEQRALAIAEAARTTAATEAAAADAQVTHALCQAGFATEDAARSAVLAAQTSAEIAQRARTWHTDHAIAATRVSELVQVTDAEEVDAQALAAARGEAEAARQLHGTLLTEQGKLSGERGELAGRIAKAAALREQLARSQAEHLIYDQLAADLRTDQFQAYLLEGTFRDIVQGASVRLLELSAGRYALDYAQDDFFVIDHDNARELRRADTLSGGETFLTSLALALQLSEQVQRAAGAVRLDSLFIDEGFGTLDPETLATVSDAIQQLGRGHRMVGIITHVQDLTSALPARIDVVRGPDGSRIKVISEA